MSMTDTSLKERKSYYIIFELWASGTVYFAKRASDHRTAPLLAVFKRRYTYLPYSVVIVQVSF